jgi:hypothetical protein
VNTSNAEPVTYYADPRYSSSTTGDHTVESFLENFNQAPKSVRLQVTGFVPVHEEAHGSVQWQGGHYFIAFTFALDLSSWVTRIDRPAHTQSSQTSNGSLQTEHGVLVEDLARLRSFLADSKNDLASIDIEKSVSWPDWEELATNIKLRIRQLGFRGVVSVNCSDVESLTVYKNTVWANFMHNRTTKVLCALSLIGWMIYLPYMWLRCTKTVVRSLYRIDVSISQYWDLIAGQLSANGFETNGRPPHLSVPMAPPFYRELSPGRFPHRPGLIPYHFTANR